MNSVMNQKLIKNKLGLLKLAVQLGSVSQACRIVGFTQFKELSEYCSQAKLDRLLNQNQQRSVFRFGQHRWAKLFLAFSWQGYTR